ncbi:DUF2617 family protein [Tautonia sociabilis]|uniref:DUF2617 family protein n=1 Tax=Tautonia sociabilis TaxID=2080755 RepID=A0A432MHU3_9BACT|nr:DUF2617 family protein [Tautonia sociabilis]RUL86717.1 DUF2617 family protein [Tautonia sociabilis]
MGVSYGRSKVVDVSFQVFARAIHPDFFAVRGHRRISRPAWEADLRIIEGGHAITWSSGPIRLTEVLCGPETPLPDDGQLLRESVRHERSATLRRGATVEYQTCFDAERLDGEVFRHLCDELALDASKGLYHRFSPPNRLAPSPVSFIRIDSRFNGLSVQAFHTFPDDRSIVRTQSLFEVLDLRRD